ncbi:MAG TPA: SH3 domain-containing protein [Tepidisphaeraceae bacterium]|jgi:hypothetical protein
MTGRKKTLRTIAAAVLAGAVITGAAFAEDVVVKLPHVGLLAQKSGKGPRVAELKDGDKLQVVGKEGTWLRVKAGDKEGYVQANSVGTGQGGGSSFNQMIAGTSEASSAAAGKGLGEALKYAQTKGMSTAGLDRMIALSKSLTPADWEKFNSQAGK